MIFTLVSSAQEWLNTKWDEVKKMREENERRREQEIEEAERVLILSTFLIIHVVLYFTTMRCVQIKR